MALPRCFIQKKIAVFPLSCCVIYAAAVQIVKKHGGEINDLYAAVKNCPTHYYSDMTHLYTKEGTRLLTERVIGAIEGALGIHAKRLNYEALFATPDSITGV